MMIKPIYNWLVASRTTKRGDCEPNPKTRLKISEVLVQGGLMKLNLLSVVGLFENKVTRLISMASLFSDEYVETFFSCCVKKMYVAVVLR